MNKIARRRMVKAMEYIARKVNDERIFNSWLRGGVADGDIEYGDLSDFTLGEDENTLEEYFQEDEEFADLMALFLRIMARANQNGGLYCDGVCSDPIPRMNR